MKNKIKIVVGITMMVQAVVSFIMFIVFACKKKKLWSAFLAIAAAGSAGGAYLLFDGLSDGMRENEMIDDYDDDSTDFDEFLGGDEAEEPSEECAEDTEDSTESE